MASCARNAFAAALHDGGLATDTSVRLSTWPSRNATWASRPPCRKCVVGWGEPAGVATGAAIEYDSCAAGVPNVEISAESLNRNVCEVDGKSVIRFVTKIGAEK